MADVVVGNLECARWCASKEGFVLEFDECGRYRRQWGRYCIHVHLYKFSTHWDYLTATYMYYAKSVCEWYSEIRPAVKPSCLPPYLLCVSKCMFNGARASYPGCKQLLPPSYPGKIEEEREKPLVI